jgi:hypothetical protein
VRLSCRASVTGRAAAVANDKLTKCQNSSHGRLGAFIRRSARASTCSTRNMLARRAQQETWVNQIFEGLPLERAIRPGNAPGCGVSRDKRDHVGPDPQSRKADLDRAARADCYSSMSSPVLFVVKRKGAPPERNPFRDVTRSRCGADVGPNGVGKTTLGLPARVRCGFANPSDRPLQGQGAPATNMRCLRLWLPAG